VTVVTVVELEVELEVVQAMPATEEVAEEEIKGVMAAEMASARQQAGKR